jgi:hypothetical protein
MVHDRAVVEAELLLEVAVAAEHGQIRLSVTGGDLAGPGWGSGPHDTVSGTAAVLVATDAGEGGAVAVKVYDGRPRLKGWTLAHTARLTVGTDGIDVGTPAGAIDHWVPAPEGPTTVEVWTRAPGEITFVLAR